jgi:hypothetical protein
VGRKRSVRGKPSQRKSTVRRKALAVRGLITFITISGNDFHGGFAISYFVCKSDIALLIGDGERMK